MFELYCSPLHALTNGLWTNLGITSKQRRKKWFEKEIEASVMKEYERRYSLASQDNERMVNMLDMMVEHNIKAEKEGRTSDILTAERIVGNTGFFYLAGYVTSVDTMIGGMTYIAERPDWVTKCVKEGLNSPEQILSNESLKNSIKETLRLCPPIPLMIPRLIIKDCNIDGIPLKKGDYVTLPFGG